MALLQWLPTCSDQVSYSILVQLSGGAASCERQLRRLEYGAEAFWRTSEPELCSEWLCGVFDRTSDLQLVASHSPSLCNDLQRPVRVASVEIPVLT
jgi:ABC-type uncharacterized transport system auxiliary subunit